MRSCGTQSKNCRLRNHELTARANTRVVTARYSPRRRNAGNPTTNAAAAPAAPPASSARVMSAFQFSVHFALTAAPMATNAIWPSEIWPAQPESTTSDRPITANTTTAVALMIWSVRRSIGIRARPTRISAAVPQRRSRTSGRRATAGRSGRTSSASRQPAASSRSARPYWRRCRTQRDQDERTDDRHHEQRTAGVPGHAVLEHAERHRSRGDRREVAEPPDHERRECLDEGGQAERGTEGNAEDPGTEEQRQEGQPGGDRPHERGQPGDGDAQHQCPLAAFGRTADRGSDAGGAEEHRHPDHRQRSHHERDQIVGGEDERADGDLPVDRRRDAFDAALSSHIRGTSSAKAASNWVMPIVRDREDETRRSRETADEGELDDGAQCDGRREPHTETEQVRQAGEHDQADCERRGHEAEVGLGEVDHPVGPVDERHADRQQGDQQAENDTADPGPGGQPEEHELDRDETQRRPRTAPTSA